MEEIVKLKPIVKTILIKDMEFGQFYYSYIGDLCQKISARDSYNHTRNRRDSLDNIEISYASGECVRILSMNVDRPFTKQA